MTKLGHSTLAAALGIGLLLALCGVSVVMSRAKSAELAGYGSQAQPIIDLVALRRSVIDGADAQGRAKPGFSKQVAWFRTGHGDVVNLWLAEAGFASTGIERWQPKDNGPTVLFNSVDERQGGSGGSSVPIGIGCGLGRIEGRDLRGGEAEFHDCEGSYRASGIEQVANIAVVTFSEDPDSWQKSCLGSYVSETDQDAYRTCVVTHIKNGLKAALSSIRRDDRRATNVLIPELGTGTGQLEKSQFYDAFFDEFRSELQSANFGRGQLPINIYFQVWSGDRQNGSFHRSAQAISDELRSLVPDWQNQPRPQTPVAWLRIAGMSGSLALLVSLVLIFPRLSNWMPEVARLSGQLVPLRLLAWVAVTFGVIEGVVRLFDPLLRDREIAHFAISFLAVPLAPILLRAIRSVEADFKQEPSSKPAGG